MFPYIGLNYAIYEFLRPALVVYSSKSEEEENHLGMLHPSIPGQILCAVSAATGSQVLTYPFDLLKRKLQVQGAWLSTPTQKVIWPEYASLWDCAKQTMQESKFKVPPFYRGLVPNVVKVLPSALISFLAYEKLRTTDV